MKLSSIDKLPFVLELAQLEMSKDEVEELLSYIVQISAKRRAIEMQNIINASKNS